MNETLTCCGVFTPTFQTSKVPFTVGFCHTCGTLYRLDEHGVLRAWSVNGRVSRVLTTSQWAKTGIFQDLEEGDIEGLATQFRKFELHQEREPRDWGICAIRYVYGRMVNHQQREKLLPLLDVAALTEMVKKTLCDENVVNTAKVGETLMDVEADLLAKTCDSYLEGLVQSTL